MCRDTRDVKAHANCHTELQIEHCFFNASAVFHSAQVGDLRPYLMGFFDTTVGGKKEAASYTEIASSLAVDSPGEILFATDIVEEAQAAQAAGWRSVLVARPGNKELPADHGFPVIASMDELLDAY
jgi:methylthioribulose 1-phosphate dehydratase / enolase-phosphatase E1